MRLQSAINDAVARAHHTGEPRYVVESRDNHLFRDMGGDFEVFTHDQFLSDRNTFGHELVRVAYPDGSVKEPLF